MARNYTIQAGKNPVPMVTLAELAWHCGKRSKLTLLKLITLGVMPDANYRLPRKPNTRGALAGQNIPGQRLYSLNVLVPVVSRIFEDIKQGRQITHDQKNALIQAFVDEKKHFSQT